MKNYVLPFFYTFHTRIKKNVKKIAYLFTFIIPVFLYGISVTDIKYESILWAIVAITVSLIGTMSIYELGYIRNDMFAIKKEKKPTLRLTEKEILYIEENFREIIAIKYLIAIISLGIIYLMGYGWIKYLIGLILIEVFYYSYNNFRYKISILNFFVLSTLRYIVPLLILSIHLGVLVAVFILVISIPRTIEKAAEKRFNIRILYFINNTIDLNLLRFLYYIVLFISVVIQVFISDISNLFLILTGYYLFYRGAIFMAVSIKNKKNKF